MSDSEFEYMQLLQPRLSHHARSSKLATGNLPPAHTRASPHTSVMCALNAKSPPRRTSVRTLGLHIPTADARKLFDYFDEDGNGKIDLEEFCTAIYGNEVGIVSYLSLQQDREGAGPSQVLEKEKPTLEGQRLRNGTPHVSPIPAPAVEDRLVNLERSVGRVSQMLEWQGQRLVSLEGGMERILKLLETGSSPVEHQFQSKSTSQRPAAGGFRGGASAVEPSGRCHHLGHGAHIPGAGYAHEARAGYEALSGAYTRNSYRPVPLSKPTVQRASTVNDHSGPNAARAQNSQGDDDSGSGSRRSRNKQRVSHVGLRLPTGVRQVILDSTVSGTSLGV